mmetsp:Transcript_37117/g.89970  ORF Transcript_37117/g.89970 Transcript_37117/m.89970 type:complete len:947 (+) Transcript_37117:228-3068(+)
MGVSLPPRRSSTMTRRILIVLLVLWCALNDGTSIAVVSGVESSTTVQRPRPSLVGTRIKLEEDFGGGGRLSGNGQAMSFDGTFIIKRISMDRWDVRALRPQNIAYNTDGIPQFDEYFSPAGARVALSAGENALTLCFSNGGPWPKQYFDIAPASGNAVYKFYIIDSMMDSSMVPNGAQNPLFIQLRRREATVIISNPFTTQAEIAQFNISTSVDDFQLLKTTEGTPVYGIESTMTADGKLLVFQGHPTKHDAGDVSSGDILMYSYNPNPCAVHGWSKPRMLHQMHSHSQPSIVSGDDPSSTVSKLTKLALERYPLSWNTLKAPIGYDYNDEYPLRGAYPWLDPEGRFLLFTAARFMSSTDSLGARREAVSLIGSDTLWATYNIDGGINESRSKYSRLFFSSPMWAYEQERHLSIIGTGTGVSFNSDISSTSNNNFPILPITKNHDVIPLFGTNTLDYNEVDVGELTDPFYIISLPMNELITMDGHLAIRQTPDLSGYHSVGTLIGRGGYITENNTLSFSSSGFLNETYAKGRVLILRGQDGLYSKLTNPVVSEGLSGFSFQLYLHPDLQLVSNECLYDGLRYILHIPDTFDLMYDARSNSIQLRIMINGTWVSLGYLPVPVGRWSHVAYSWDGVSGEFREYLDGVRTTRVLPANIFGRLDFAAQDFFVGTNSSLKEWRVEAQQCDGFVGRVDEVRLYSHARSGRSICLSTQGTSCIDQATTDTPTIGHSVLSLQHPGCDDVSKSNTEACQRALHRVCANTGATHALSSATNLWRTIQQLIGQRPPVSLAGVVTDVPSISADNLASVACLPMPQESKAVTFEELSNFDPGCSSEKFSHTTQCLSATKRFCRRMGWDTGMIFEVSTRAWVTCFQADEILALPESTFEECMYGNQDDYQCRFVISSFCKSKGYDAGLYQERFGNPVDGGTMQIHCFHASTVDDYPFRPF